MTNKWYELDEIAEDQIKYVITIAEYQGELIIIRHKDRDVWELPGGKREAGETVVDAAARELYEESGAVRFELIPYGVYYKYGSYGAVFYAKIEELGPLPDFEIAERRLCRSLPSGLNYEDLYYKTFEKWEQVQSQPGLAKQAQSLRYTY